MEKWYYGLMALVIAFSVLASPFFYARSIKFLDQRLKNRSYHHNQDIPPKDES